MIGTKTGIFAGKFVPPFDGNFTWWANINDTVFSNSGGTDYADSIPLTGIADQFEQPVAASRPLYIANGLDGNATIQAIASNQKMYKAIDASVFNGGGVFAFIGRLDGNIGGQNVTFFTEAEANAASYNYQIYTGPTLGALRFYTQIDGVQVVQNPFSASTWAVFHFVLSGTTLKTFVNGLLVSTVTINQSMTTAKPLTMFNYKGINSEQGVGSLGDMAVLTGATISDSNVLADYNNFWKAKYPSLP